MDAWLSCMMEAHVLAHFWPKAIVVSISGLAYSFPSPYEVTYRDYLLVLWQISEAINGSNLTNRYILVGMLRVLKSKYLKILSTTACDKLPTPLICLSFENISVAACASGFWGGEGAGWAAGTEMDPSFTDEEHLANLRGPEDLVSHTTVFLF